MTYSFKPFGAGQYVERDTLADIKHHIRQYSPCSTKYKAIGLPNTYGPTTHAVISFSPYTIGPNLVGYMGQG